MIKVLGWPEFAAVVAAHEDDPEREHGIGAWNRAVRLNVDGEIGVCMGCGHFSDRFIECRGIRCGGMVWTVTVSIQQRL